VVLTSRTQHQTELERLKLELTRSRQTTIEQADRLEKLKKQNDTFEVRIQDMKKSMSADQAEIKDLRVKLRMAEHERTQLSSKQGELETKKALQAVESRREGDVRERDRKIAELEKTLAGEKKKREGADARLKEVKAAIEAMRRRRSGPDDLLVFREAGTWRDVRSEEVNAYLQEKAGEEFSAKDFRTWHGTVLAAVELAREKASSSKGGGERAIRVAIKRVAERLGNTPAVCRSSYIDPRVLDRFRDGKTIELPTLTAEGTVTPRQQGLIERRVLELIG